MMVGVVNNTVVMATIIFTIIELLLVSYEIEAPETTNEKQRYHQLKYVINQLSININ